VSLLKGVRRHFFEPRRFSAELFRQTVFNRICLAIRWKTGGSAKVISSFGDFEFGMIAVVVNPTMAKNPMRMHAIARRCIEKIRGEFRI